MREPERRPWPGTLLWHLVWLVNLLWQPLLDPEHVVVASVAALAVTIVFVPLFLAVQVREDVARWAPWAIVALAVAAVPFNVGASVLLVYVAGMVASQVSRAVLLRWMVALSALIIGFIVVAPIPMPWGLLSLVPSLLLTWVVGLMSAAAAEESRITRLRNAQVEHLATLSERERIARDLHDLLGQTLTGIIVRSQLAQRLVAKDLDAGVREMAEVEKIARAALTEVRATVSGWRQVDLDEEIAAATNALTAAGITVSVAREPGLTLSPTVESALGLALREGVTNIVRHAHASRCTLALRRRDDDVVLEVSDDGIGGGIVEGNGLRGMRERIGALGGHVDRLGRSGTALTVSVPAVVAT